MVANDYPEISPGGPVSALDWFGPVARDLTAVKAQVASLGRGISLSRDGSFTAVTGVAGAETDIWSVNWVPPVQGNYEFYSRTPFDGTAGEEAKFRLYVDGIERVFDIARMAAGGFVGNQFLSTFCDVTNTGTVVVKVTAVRTSGANGVNCRLANRQVFAIHRGPIGLAIP